MGYVPEIFFGIPPVVVTRDIDPGLKNKVREAFLSMGSSPKGKAILDAMMIDGFEKGQERQIGIFRRNPDG